MAGLTEDGGEGGKAQIGFGGEPVRRVDEQHLHLPAAGGFGGFTMEHDQLLRSPFALRILNPHSDLILSYTRMTRNCQKAKGLA